MVERLLNAFLEASSVRFDFAQRHKGMNSITNHIKPAFAPETEFEVQTLIIMPGDQATGDSVPSESLDLCTQNEFDSWSRSAFSALND